MTGLRIIECGPGTTLQDRGRHGYRRFGVSTSGAMDPEAAALANALTGNPPDTASVEFQMVGGRMAVEGCDLIVALSGPGSALRVAGAIVPDGRSVAVRAGEIIEIGPVSRGVFAYLAVGGGFNLPTTMGSLSVHRRSGIGGRPLAAGDFLPAAEPNRGTLSHITPAEPCSGPIRLVAGPQDDHFTSDALALLTDSTFVVRPDSDRMAYRLSGPTLSHRGDGNIVSDGVLAGSVQVPGDGVPTILMRDCQTTGGYPKIATVISADIGRMAQIPPGNAVRFALVTLGEAVAAARLAASRLQRHVENVLPEASLPTTDSLLRTNLVGGVTAGQ